MVVFSGISGNLDCEFYLVKTREREREGDEMLIGQILSDYKIIVDDILFERNWFGCHKFVGCHATNR